MVTETLDLNSLIREAEAAQKEDFAPAETDIGHVHLQVADLDRAKDFYHGLLGLDITQDSYPGALFLSAGGYHHHVGLNIWAGRGVPPPPPDALGLTAFSLLLPDQASMQNLIERIQAASITTESETIPKMGLFHLLDDPDGIGVALSIN